MKKYSKPGSVSTRAILRTIAPFSHRSLATGSSEVMMARAREVGIPRPAIASLMRYSRIEERNTALPSPGLE